MDDYTKLKLAIKNILIEEGLGTYIKKNVVGSFMDQTVGDTLKQIDKNIDRKVTSKASKTLSAVGAGKDAVLVADFIKTVLYDKQAAKKIK